MSLPRRAVPLERLVDADPSWSSYIIGQGHRDQSGTERKGVALIFECPIHDHYLSVPLRNPLDGGPPIADWFPSGALWEMQGNPHDFASLTFSPSIHVEGGEKGCEWHGWIQNGRFVHCGDSA